MYMMPEHRNPQLLAGNSSGRHTFLHLAILLVVSLVCFAGLSLKPVHVDESVNGFFVNQLWGKGFFLYDPTNYHGPLLFYLLQISEKLFGFGIRSFRLVTASFVVFTIWFILRNHALLGRNASLCIASALALSPGMIFFGRSAIHEPVFVFFQICWMIGFLKFREQMSQPGVLWFLTGIVGCMLLKETFVVLGIAFLAAWGWTEVSPMALRWIHREVDPPPDAQWQQIHKSFLLKSSFVAVLIWLVFLTGFFHNWKGVPDFFAALMPWLKTGTGGSGHDKPFDYWLTLFRRYEWAALTGLFAAGAGIFFRSWKARFFSALALGNGLIYSLIPYKTPWCIISILWPFVFAAGFLFDSILRNTRFRKALLFPLSLIVFCIVIAYSAWTTYRLNFINYADASEPYVYVQTKKDFQTIEDILNRKTDESPVFHNMHILIQLKDPWPLPWVFSRYPNVSYGFSGNPFQSDADIIFAESPGDRHPFAGFYRLKRIELRDAREPVDVFFKRATFPALDMQGATRAGQHTEKDG